MHAFLHALQNNPGCRVGRYFPYGRRIRGRARWKQNGADILRDHPAEEQYGSGEGGNRGKRAPEHIDYRYGSGRRVRLASHSHNRAKDRVRTPLRSRR